MKCTFTIVASNYIPLANILGESIKRKNPDNDFLIFVVDKNIDKIYQTPFYIVDITKLAISAEVLDDMAFKYNITEFCTSVKPFCFEYIFKQNYDKVIYFDPDIFVYNSLNSIYNQLENTDIVLTPHINEMQETYNGFVNEGNILFAGTYNLGFCAIKNSSVGINIINWWKDRLTKLCYADKIDGLHVDQKWMDFLPSLLNKENYYINRDLGCNVAYWNWQERKLIKEEEHWYVLSRNNLNANNKTPLLFFHFSTYSYKEAENIEKFMPFPFKLKKEYDDIVLISKEYSNFIINQKLPSSLVAYKYPYGYFSNEKPILAFHRRLYRRLTQEGEIIKEPFKDTGSFYQLIKKNKLISKSDKKIDKLNENNYTGFTTKFKIVKLLFKLLKFILGIDNYSLFLKFLTRFIKTENQTFLLNNKKYNYPFYNENRYLER